LNNEISIISGFLLGLFGSLHCIGMCGPILLALPGKNKSKIKLIISRIFYNSGRVLTYSFLGLIFGLLGSRLHLFGLQQITSITFGAIIIIYVLTPQKFRQKISSNKAVVFFVERLKEKFSIFFKKDTLTAMLAIGILNGFLPCGFVYIAIAGSISTGSIVDGILFMAMFGVGTIPIMLAASLFASFINFTRTIKIRKLIPVLSIILAVIFIIRGLNLGINYLSPKINYKLLDKDSVKKTEIKLNHNCCDQ